MPTDASYLRRSRLSDSVRCASSMRLKASSAMACWFLSGCSLSASLWKAFLISPPLAVVVTPGAMDGMRSNTGRGGGRGVHTCVDVPAGGRGAHRAPRSGAPRAARYGCRRRAACAASVAAPHLHSAHAGAAARAAAAAAATAAAAAADGNAAAGQSAPSAPARAAAASRASVAPPRARRPPCPTASPAADDLLKLASHLPRCAARRCAPPGGQGPPAEPEAGECEQQRESHEGEARVEEGAAVSVHERSRPSTRASPRQRLVQRVARDESARRGAQKQADRRVPRASRGEAATQPARRERRAGQQPERPCCRRKVGRSAPPCGGAPLASRRSTRLAQQRAQLGPCRVQLARAAGLQRRGAAEEPLRQLQLATLPRKLSLAHKRCGGLGVGRRPGLS
eukprot:scaffold118224_cov67-Phaeocystis_antarctica.AAC.3